MPDFWLPTGLFEGETVAILGGGRSLSDEQIAHVRGRCRVVAINRAYARAPWADWLYGADAGWFWAWTSGPLRINKSEPDALEFAGTKICLWSLSPGWPAKHQAQTPRLIEGGVKFLRHRGDDWHTGVETESGFVRGNNSCFHLVSSVLPQAGAKQIILLGVDMGGPHWHASWPMASPPYESWGHRKHRAAIEVDGREVELGWFESKQEVAKVESRYAYHIRQGCPQPSHGFQPRMIGNFATLLRPLAELGIEVVNCSPGSHLKVFPQANLEEVL